MTVVEGWFSGSKFTRLPDASELSKELMDNLRINISMNSKAFLVDNEKGGRIGYIGSSTECALLLALRTWGFDYKEVRAQHEQDLVQVGHYVITQLLLMRMNCNTYYNSICCTFYFSSCVLSC